MLDRIVNTKAYRLKFSGHYLHQLQALAIGSTHKSLLCFNAFGFHNSNGSNAFAPAPMARE